MIYKKYEQDRRGGGVEGVKGPGPGARRYSVTKNFVIAIHLCSAFCDNSSALRVFARTVYFDDSFTVRNQIRRNDISNLSKLVLSQRVSRWCRRVVKFPFTFTLFGL